MWKYGNAFLRQKFSNWKRSVSWRVIVLKQPVVCNVRSDSPDQFSKSFQGIFAEGVINCLSCRYKFFVHSGTAVGGGGGPIIIVFTLDLLMRAFFGRNPFVCHSTICRLVSGIVVEHPWFISCYYFTPQKIWLNFESCQQILTKFPTGSLFLLHRQVFGASFTYIFRTCKRSARILWTAPLSKPVSSAIILTLNRLSFAITARTTSTFWSFCWRDWSSRTRAVFNIFSAPFCKLCAT